MDRMCEVCHGPITTDNRTGICAKTTGCRSALRKRISGKRPEPVAETPDNCPWLRPESYDLDTGELIIDQVAIDVAVEGRRRVRLTHTERKEVIRRMIAGSWDAREIAQHCGTILQRLDPIFTELGYEVVPTIKPNGRYGKATIRKIKEEV